MKVALAFSAVLLSGCAFFATNTFDPVEYDHWVKVGFLADKANANCGLNESAVHAYIVKSSAEYALSYSRSKIKSTRVAQAGEIVLSFSDELLNRYTTGTPSTAYCKLKTEAIAASARAIAESIAKKET